MSVKQSRLSYLLLVLILLGLVGCASGGDVDDGSETEPSGPSDGADLGPTSVYTSDSFRFEVAYPQDDVFSEVPAGELSQLQPTPAAWFKISRAGATSGDVVEPAELEIRVFDAAGAGAVEAWLETNNLLSADDDTPLSSFSTDNVSGVELCGGTMIGPGCAYYVLEGDWLYQLIPASLEGEAMIHTFDVMS